MTEVEHKESSVTDITKYVPRPGRSASDGPDFELNYCQYLYIKYGFDNNCNNFSLLNNIDKLGAFDDIALGLEYNDKKYSFVFQLKHKQSCTVNKESLFDGKLISLPKQCASSEIVKEYFENNPHVLPGGYKNCNFIIFTNTTCDESFNTLKSDSTIPEHILELNTSNNESMFRFNKLSSWEKVTTNTSENVTLTQNLKQIFIKEFEIIYKELDKKKYSPLQLEGIMKNTCHEIKRVIVSMIVKKCDPQLLYPKEKAILDFEKEIENTIEHFFSKLLMITDQKNTNEIPLCTIDIIKRYFPNIDHKILLEKTKLLLKTNFIDGIITKKQTFKHQMRDFLHEQLDQNVINNEYTCLNEDSAKQVLDVIHANNHIQIYSSEEEFIQFKYKVKCIVRDRKMLFMTSEQVEKYYEELDWYYKNGGERTFLIIQSASSTTRVPTTVEYKILHYNIVKKIQEKDNEIPFYQVTNNIFTSQHVSENTSLTELYIERSLYIQQNIVTDVKQLFQMDQQTHLFIITLSQYFDEIFTRYIESDTSRYTEPTRATIKTFKVRDQKIISKEYKNFYIINNSTDHPLLEELFDQFKTIYCKSSIHWFHETDEKLYWTRTYGQTIDVGDRTKLQFNNIDQMTHRFIPIHAEPGMGKTTLLNRLSCTLKQHVIHIILNQIQHLLDEFNFDHLENIVEFLTHMSSDNKNNEHYKDLVTLLLQIKNQTVVLIDGLDEVSPHFNTETIKLIECFKQHTNIKQLIVTSRLTFEFGDKMPTYRLVPFSKQNQMDYLTQFCKKHNNSMTDEQIKLFVENLLNKLYVQLQTEHLDLLGIPLQTNMLASIYCQNISDDIFDFSFLSLFQNFIDKKIQIYIKEKLGAFSENMVNKQIKKEKDKIYKSCPRLATFTLTNSTQDCPVTMKETKITELTTELQDIGLISHVSNKQIQFIHKTIQEYFTAVYFYQHFKTQQEFIRKHLFTKEFNVVRLFFDLLLCEKCLIHKIIINNNVEQFNKQINNLNEHEVDEGSRNIFHIAFIYNRPDMLKQLLEKTQNKQRLLSHKDEVVGYIPRMYCFISRCWDVYSVCVEFDDNNNDFNELNDLNDDDIKHLISCCIFNHCVKLFNILTEKYQQQISKLDFTNFIYEELDKFQLDSRHVGSVSVLDLAAFHGNTLILQLIIDKYQVSNRTQRSTRYKFESGLIKDKALMFCCMGEHLDCIDLLITNGAHMETFYTAVKYSLNTRGDRIAHLLARNNKVNVLQHLIQKYQININIRNEDRQTPLMRAAEFTNPVCVGLFLNNKARVNSINKKKNSALHYACMNESGDVKIIQLLHQHGVNINFINKYNQTPVDVARIWSSYYDNKGVINYLLQNGGVENVKFCVNK